jgi:hypothetical protein
MAVPKCVPADTAYSHLFFYAHDAHGIELIWDNLPAHRGVKQDTHQILEMGLALTRKGEPLQPLRPQEV